MILHRLLIGLHQLAHFDRQLFNLFCKRILQSSMSRRSRAKRSSITLHFARKPTLIYRLPIAPPSLHARQGGYRHPGGNLLEQRLLDVFINLDFADRMLFLGAN